MSFSGEMKEEIARLIPEKEEEVRAELMAIIRFCGRILRQEESVAVFMDTENVVLAKTYVKLIKRAFDLQVQLEIRRHGTGKYNQYFILLSERPEDMLYSEERPERQKLQQAGVFGSNKQLGHARLLGGKGHGQGTGNGAQCAIQPKLTQKCLVRLWLRDVLLRRQNANEHRQIIQTAGLAHIGGGQVDGNMAGGPGAVQVFDGAAHPLTAFLHGGIRKATIANLGRPPLMWVSTVTG